MVGEKVDDDDDGGEDKDNHLSPPWAPLQYRWIKISTVLDLRNEFPIFGVFHQEVRMQIGTR